MNGKPVKDFRITWDALTKAAKMPRLLVHDLRRSRQEFGTPRYRASGYANLRTQSRSVFDRHNIVSESNLAESALKVESGAKAGVAKAKAIRPAVPS